MIRTEKAGQVDSPCYACLVNERGRVRASHIVLPPFGAPSGTVGLSACDDDLERTQYVVTHYADDEEKMTRLLLNKETTT